MKKYFPLLLLGFLLVFSCTNSSTEDKTATSKKDTFVEDNYTKKEVAIKMRDGITLHTTIYAPKDTSKEFPIFKLLIGQKKSVAEFFLTSF